jgi:hypothetical protein
MASGDFTEFFQQLLFGTGAWLGAILIVSIIVIVTVKNRLSGAIFMPICIFLGIQYFNTVSSSSDLMWIGILMFIMAIYSLSMLISGIKKE